MWKLKQKVKKKLYFIKSRKFIIILLSLPLLYSILYGVLYFTPIFINNKDRIGQKYKEIIEASKASDSNLIDLSSDELEQLENTLIIPVLGIEMPISGGDQNMALHNGIWFDERSSTPLKGGNTVLSGHRFYYSWLGDAFNKANYSLYRIDELTRDDLIILIWDHKIYRYFVTEVAEIKTNDLTLLQETDKPQLTLYSCTPLPITDFSKRLVVIAK